MKERPIIFDAESVRAILAGRKTQTRRVVKPQPSGVAHRIGKLVEGGPARLRGKHCLFFTIASGNFEMTEGIPCPYGQPGDLLWVREAWAHPTKIVMGYDGMSGPGEGECFDRDKPALYKADSWYPEGHVFVDHPSGHSQRWRSPIQMPRWASRLTLRVTDVRVERLQEISWGDVLKEGINRDGNYWIGGPHPVKGTPKVFSTPFAAFGSRWDSINAKRAPWSSNPWVWVVEFERVEAAHA